MSGPFYSISIEMGIVVDALSVVFTRLYEMQRSALSPDSYSILFKESFSPVHGS